MTFEYMEEPDWLTLDRETKNALISMSFQEDIESDDEWNSLPESTQKAIRAQYFTDADQIDEYVTAPEEGGFLKRAAKGLLRGTTHAVGSIGEVLQMADLEPEEVDTDVGLLDTAGSAISDWAEETTKESSLMRKDKGELAGDLGFIQRGVLGGIESSPLTASVWGLAGAGAIAGSAIPGIGTLAGGAIGGVTGLVLMFGVGQYGQEYSDIYKELEATSPNLSEEEKRAKAHRAALGGAAFEVGTELPENIIALFTLGGSKIVTQPLKATLKGMVRKSGKQWVKDTGKAGAGQVVGEMVAGGGQAWVREKEGLLGPSIGEGVSESIIPAMTMSLFFGAGAAGLNRYNSQKILNRLNSDNPHIRIAAITDMAKRIEKNTKDKELADAWTQQAAQTILNDEHFDFDERLVDFAQVKIAEDTDDVSTSEDETPDAGIMAAQTADEAIDIFNRDIDKPAILPSTLLREDLGASASFLKNDQERAARILSDFQSRPRTYETNVDPIAVSRELNRHTTQADVEERAREGRSAEKARRLVAGPIEAQRMLNEEELHIQRGFDPYLGDKNREFLQSIIDENKPQRVAATPEGELKIDGIWNDTGLYPSDSELPAPQKGDTPSAPDKPPAETPTASKGLGPDSSGLSTTFNSVEKQLKKGTIKDVNKEIDKIASETSTDLTDKQKESGRYKKGKIPGRLLNLAGTTIAVENEKGSVRSGTDEKGNKWSTTMKNIYGYFERTKGKDGDQIDVFVGPNVGSKKAYIIDQRNPNTGKFDEHKTLVGFNSKKAAREAYLSNYEKGWKGLGSITEMPIEEFKKWVGDGKRKTKAVSKSFKETFGQLSDRSQKVGGKPAKVKPVKTLKDLKVKGRTKKKVAKPIELTPKAGYVKATEEKPEISIEEAYDILKTEGHAGFIKRAGKEKTKLEKSWAKAHEDAQEFWSVLEWPIPEDATPIERRRLEVEKQKEFDAFDKLIKDAEESNRIKEVPKKETKTKGTAASLKLIKQRAKELKRKTAKVYFEVKDEETGETIRLEANEELLSLNKQKEHYTSLLECLTK